MTSTVTRGPELLRDPSRNRGTAFTEEQRDALGLTGLLPPAIETLEQRIKRIRWQLDACETDLARYVLLAQLMDTDETSLFYGSSSQRLRNPSLIAVCNLASAFTMPNQSWKNTAIGCVASMTTFKAQQVSLWVVSTQHAERRERQFSAGCGIAGLIVVGLPAEDASSRVALFNRHGLLTKDRTDLSDFGRCGY